MDNTTASVDIRGARTGDLDAIIDIDTQASGAAKPDYWREAFSSYGRRKDNRFFLVAEQEGLVVGFIIGEIRAWEFGSSPCGWVYAIGVRPERRQRNIGSRMLDALCRLFHAAGIAKVRTMTVRQDHDLLAFFRSQGLMAGPYQQLEKELD